MKKFSFFGSLMTAVLVAVIAFFVLYFFVPSLSDSFFGFSYQSSRDTKQLQEAVTDILEDARVPKVAIDEYVAKLDDPQLRQSLSEAAKKGTDAVVGVLEKAGEGIDFGSFETAELGDKLSSGFSRLSSFTSKQWKSLQRIFAGALDSL
ncbi:hypothetical protein [Pleomorphochaeta sp. DL1XJH-081]|jgi:hypothetical protein|uniref:hypothetical protein n=1 Tax=Pleomorphochaeta sp. DL1XJH-081 TaxID=3409690 RepID=UPI003BB78D7C